jgi:superfamily II DNA/RNA helicase
MAFRNGMDTRLYDRSKSVRQLQKIIHSMDPNYSSFVFVREKERLEDAWRVGAAKGFQRRRVTLCYLHSLVQT